MKRCVLWAALVCTVLAGSATPASARYYYRRPVARTAARVVLPPYRVVAPRAYYGPRYYGYGPRYYGPRYYGPRAYGYYGPGWGFYGPGAYVGVGVY
jgi:hypothetical protein